MKKKGETSIAIVGGGPGCKAILDLFDGNTLKELRITVLGIADINENAIGFKYEKEKGIFTTRTTRETPYFTKYKDER